MPDNEYAVHITEEIGGETVIWLPESGGEYSAAAKQSRWEQVLNDKRSALLMMFGLLLQVFWITISGTNYPTQ